MLPNKAARFFLLATMLVMLVMSLSAAAMAAKEITWYTWPWNARAEEMWKKDLAEFQASTGIKVNVINMVPATDRGYDQKLLLLFASGNAPDLIHLRGQREFPMMGSMEAVRDLEPALRKSSLPLKDYAPSLMDSFKWEGVQIGLPDSADFYLTLYNVDEFNRAGLSKPPADWTWEDLRNLARKLTIDKNGDGIPEQYGFCTPDYAYEEMILSTGIPALRGDHTWNWTAGNQPVMEMLEFWRDLFTKEKCVCPEFEDFGTAKSAIVMDGNWSLDMSQRFSFTWDVHTYPRWRQLEHGSSLIVHGYAIPKAAKNPDDAFRFLEWLLSRERQMRETESRNWDPGLVTDRFIMLKRLNMVGTLAPSLADVFLWTIENGFQPVRPSFYIGDRNYWDIGYLGQALSGEMDIRAALELTESTYNALLKAGSSWMKRNE